MRMEGNMTRRLEYIAITFLLLGLRGNPAFGQGLQPTILTIDVENVVEYQGDISDPTKFGTNPGITPSNGAGMRSGAAGGTSFV